MTDLDKHLYTTKDVQKVREQLYKEQEGIDPITRLPIPEKLKATLAQFTEIKKEKF